MRTALIIALGTICTGPAFASGGLSCTTEGQPATISIESGVTRGMGGPIFNFRGAAEFADAGVEPDLRKTAFGEEHVAQYWLDGQDLRLLLYREREGDKPHGYVEIEVRTQAGDDEGVYGGTYSLKAYDLTGVVDGEGKTVTLDGPISCFVE